MCVAFSIIVPIGKSCIHVYYYVLVGFLCNELEKAGIKPRPAGTIEAPDPQELIDLEASISNQKLFHNI